MAYPSPAPSRPQGSPAPREYGYTLLIVMFAIFLLTLGLMLAMPVWQTQVQRELEEELIFRGEQYVEAVRLFQTKNPGNFPSSFDELLEEKFIRRLFPDPMTEAGEWNVILLYNQSPARNQQGGGVPDQGTVVFLQRARQRERSTAGARGRGRAGAQQQQRLQAQAPQRILIAPQSALDAIENARIIGVVSSSDQQSIRIHNEQTSYDKWLFYYGQDPEKLPEIVYYGQEEKDE